VRRAVLERIVGEKAELAVAIALVDQPAELERERGRNRNGTMNLGIVGEHLRLFATGEHAAHHVACVIVPDAVDHGGQVVGLFAQRAFRQITQIEPHGDRQPG
jgi:hypothetical protein